MTDVNKTVRIVNLMAIAMKKTLRIVNNKAFVTNKTARIVNMKAMVMNWTMRVENMWAMVRLKTAWAARNSFPKVLNFRKAGIKKAAYTSVSMKGIKNPTKQ